MKTEKYCPCYRGLPIKNKFHGLCVFCNKERLTEGKPKKKSGIKKKPPTPTGQLPVFEQVWQEREHRCHHCLAYLGEEMKAQYFSHRIAKSIRRDLMLDKGNINLECLECHDAWEFRGKEAYYKRKNLYAPKD